MGHPDVDEKEERSDNQEESGKNDTDFADGFVLVHAEAIGQGGKDERSCAQPGEVEVHGDVEAERFLMKDVVQYLSIHSSP
jgi:hypothetical protein